MPSSSKGLLINVSALVLLAAAAAQGAQGFCALTLNIADPQGQPARRTWVQLIDPKGNVEKNELVRGPTVQFCDFGFGSHSVVVGPNLCHPTTISKIFLDLQ